MGVAKYINGDPKMKEPESWKKAKNKMTKRKKPLWKGPEEDGVTQSLLSNFFTCPERFRVKVIEGIGPPDQFNHGTGYGNMWHVCEEYLGRNQDWQKPLREYTQELLKKYRGQQPEIQKWYEICRVQFPVYVKYWEKHDDVRNRKPVMHEHNFSVPYKLPGSGRVVTLRGKWDGVDIIGRGKSAAIYLQENKTKGDVSEAAIKSQLLYDLQTMMYLIAIREEIKATGTLPGVQGKLTAPIGGVRYNVVRRPLSGGRHSIKQKKPTKKNPSGQTLAEFYAELGERIASEPEYFFMRWKSEVTAHDMEVFEQRTLAPVLERLCDWWDFQEAYHDEPAEIMWRDSSVSGGIHFQLPYGLYNPVAKGGHTDLDEYILSGNRVGLETIATLFPELE